MNVTDKLKGILTEDEIKGFEAGIATVISERVAAQVEAESEKLVKKYDLAAEEYTGKVIKEAEEKLRDELTTEYEAKIQTLSEQTETNFDRFLEQEIIPQVNDSMLEKVAVNESLAPIVRKIKAVLEESGIAIDTDGSKLLEEAQSEINKLKAENSKLISEKIELNELLEDASKTMFIAEKCEGLKPENKERVSALFESRTWEETQEGVAEYVEFLLKTEVTKSEAVGLTETETKILKEEENKVPTPPTISESQASFLNSVDYYL